MNGILTTGTIIRTIPATGTAEVLPSYSGAKRVAAVFMTETAASIYGAKGSMNMPVNTPVLLFIPERLKEGLDHAIILGAIVNNPITSENPLDTPRIVDFSSALLMAGAQNDLDDLPNFPTLHQNFNGGTFADTLPGEFSRNTLVGGGLVVGDYFSTIKSNAVTGIDFYTLSNMIRMYSDTSQQFFGNSERYIYAPTKNTRAEYYRDNPSYLSRLGITDGTAPFKTEDDNTGTYPVSRINTKDIYTRHKISGAPVDGEMDVLCYWDDNTEAVKGAVSEYKGHNGSYMVRALRDISFIKTSLIPIPEMKPDVVPGKTESTEDVPDLPEHVKKLAEGDVFVCGARAAELLDDAELEHKFLAKLKVDKENWDLDSLTEDIKNRSVSDPKLGTLSTDQPFYEEPPTRTIRPSVDKQGVTTGEEKVTDVTSFIKMLPDGSITISGSYGEEIRMFSGNIYITCPGDIIKTPGRDEVGLAGRNNIIKGNKGTVELEGNIVSTISNTNTQIVSGTSGVGGTLIENKSIMPPDDTDYEEGIKSGSGAGGGIVIKADDVVNATGNYRVTAKTSSDNCNVDINATNYYNKSDVITLFSQNQLMLATYRSVLNITGSSLEYAGTSVGFNVSEAFFTGSTVTHPITHHSIGNSGRGTGLQVGGVVNADDLYSRGSVAAAHGGMVSELTARDLHQLERAVSEYSPVAHAQAAHPLAKLSIDVLQATMPTELYTQLVLPQTRWQAMATSQNYWRNTPIDMGTNVYAYPGTKALENPAALYNLTNDGTLKKTKLKNKLIINA